MEKQKLNIYQKLLEVQKKIKGLSKDKKSHNYDYVSGNKLLSFIKPIMDEQGLLLKTEVLEIENTRQDYQVFDKWMLSGKLDAKGNPVKGVWKPKNEILSKVMMRFTWIDTETGEKDVNLFGANGQNDWEKGLGSALTYGERYFLLKYFHISTDEDDIDNPERKPVVKTPQQPTQPPAKQTPPLTQKTPPNSQSTKQQPTSQTAQSTLPKLVEKSESWEKMVVLINTGILTSITQVEGKYSLEPAAKAKIIKLIKDYKPKEEPKA